MLFAFCTSFEFYFNAAEYPNVSHVYDTWEEAAADRDKWRGMLERATFATEEEHKQEYQRTHDRRQLRPVTSFMCKQSCRSRAGLQALMGACLRRPST